VRRSLIFNLGAGSWGGPWGRTGTCTAVTRGARAWRQSLRGASAQDVQHILSALGANQSTAPVGAVGAEPAAGYAAPRPSSSGAGGAGGLATYRAVQGGPQAAAAGQRDKAAPRQAPPGARACQMSNCMHEKGAYCRASNPKFAHQEPRFRPPPRTTADFQVYLRCCKMDGVQPMFQQKGPGAVAAVRQLEIEPAERRSWRCQLRLGVSGAWKTH
jgi:hypothetical protein